MSRVLIIDGEQRSALAAVRSLGSRGITVTVAEDHLPCLASSSKYGAGGIKYASPQTQPEEFVDDLRRILRDDSYDLLIPMTDVTSYLIADHYEELSKHTTIGMPPPEAFRAASDKGEMIRLADSLGIPLPQTHFPKSLDELADLAAGLDYPVVLKPPRSRYLVGSQWVSTKVDYAGSAEELLNKVKSGAASGALPVIQERILGPGCGAFLLFQQGQEKVIFFHRRIREKPPSGGVSVLREAIPVDTAMKEHAVKLLKALNWHGVAMVEFKQDPRDNQYKLMEINARFWGSLQLAIDAGIDFPYLFYQMETGGDMGKVDAYRTGVRSRWLLGDLDHLLARLLKSNRRLNLPRGHPGRLSTLLRFLKLRESGTRYEVFRRADMQPGFYEIKKYIADVAAGLVGR
ncbi:MAG: ATP-grasp domain-containing protein [Candidatus Zixiibacteriota bacterium]|nr:MAG: ATP-grasp domain-containing protein [candidate division Zixibacteria bacterium]